MLQELHPTAKLAAQLQDPELSVWVDWGDAASSESANKLGSAIGACSLSVRQMGREIVHESGFCSAPLRVTFARGGGAAGGGAHGGSENSAAGGSSSDDSSFRGGSFLAELAWHGGRRRLHVMAPPLGRLSLDGLVLPPASHPRGLAALHARISASSSRAPLLPEHAGVFARGFGVEVEVLTESAAWPLPDSCKRGDQELEPDARTVLSRQAVLGVLSALRKAAPADEDLTSPTLASLDAALTRCGRWRSEVDVSIQPTCEGLAARMLDATTALAEIDVSDRPESTARCLQMLRRLGATRKSEFREPTTGSNCFIPCSRLYLRSCGATDDCCGSIPSRLGQTRLARRTSCDSPPAPRLNSHASSMACSLPLAPPPRPSRPLATVRPHCTCTSTF